MGRLYAPQGAGRKLKGSLPYTTVNKTAGVIAMGVTYARGSIAGKSENREYDFLVDTGATWVGIPQADIDALALGTVPNASAALMTADGNIMRTPIYVGIGMLEGTGFVNGVVPAAVPLVGYKLLQDLGFKVDLVNERIEPRPDGEIGPPFLL